jgi:hypothetical protein
MNILHILIDEWNAFVAFHLFTRICAWNWHGQLIVVEMQLLYIHIVYMFVATTTTCLIEFIGV